MRSVFSALDNVGFGGWAVVDVDQSDTPREAARISRDYLTDVLGLPA